VKKTRRRSKLKAPERIATVVVRAGEQRFAPKPPPFPLEVWRDCVGAAIARRSEPIGLEHGELLVRVQSSAWAQELSLLSVTLLERLTACGVAAEKIRFRVGLPSYAIRPSIQMVPRPVIEGVKLDEPLGIAISDVEDDDLRKVIAEAASMNLAWQRSLK
jgi:hypothetical protein